jgi:hypothetical protein
MTAVVVGTASDSDAGALSRTLLVVARGSDASMAGGGVRISQTAPTHTTTVATDTATSRAMPNHSIHERSRSAGERGGTGLDGGSTIDLLEQAHDAQHHQEGAGVGTLPLPVALTPVSPPTPPSDERRGRYPHISLIARPNHHPAMSEGVAGQRAGPDAAARQKAR